MINLRKLVLVASVAIFAGFGFAETVDSPPQQSAQPDVSAIVSSIDQSEYAGDIDSNIFMGEEVTGDVMTDDNLEALLSNIVSLGNTVHGRQLKFRQLPVCSRCEWRARKLYSEGLCRRGRRIIICRR